ncbi:Os05g0592350, partial [Oryza sativa Japonica Group]
YRTVVSDEASKTASVFTFAKRAPVVRTKRISENEAWAINFPKTESVAEKDKNINVPTNHLRSQVHYYHYLGHF